MMGVRIALRYAAIAVGTMVSVAGLFWLTWAEPWYDRDLVEQMRCRIGCAIRRDDTSRIAHIFPEGMTRDAAMTVLRRNGFGCENDRNPDSAVAIICNRRDRGLVCTPHYTI